MIEIKCPACGAEGRTPKDKILSRLVCRKCLKVFHITPSGKTVLGEPPTPGQISTASSHASAAPDRTMKVEQWFDRASKRFFSPASLILLTGLVLLAGGAIFYSMRGLERLEDRVARTARAAVEGDLRTVREMAAAGTESEVDEWYVSIRGQCDELLKRLGSKRLIVESQVKSQDPGQTWADVVASVSIEDDMQRKGSSIPDASIAVTNSADPIILPMVWTSEGFGGWRLDGKKTQELPKPVP